MPNEENLKRNSEVMDKLYEILGGSAEHKPSYELVDNLKPLQSQYGEGKIIATGEPTSVVRAANRVSDFNDALLSHELAHATSPLKKGRIGRALIRLAQITENPMYSPAIGAVSSAAQVFGGKPGLAASVVPALANLAEEGQANIRGALALRKLNGRLTPGNLAGYASSMGSYLAHNAVQSVVGPKMVQKQMGLIAGPEFAGKHKVLWDHIGGLLRKIK